MARASVSKQWLETIFKQAGYEVTELPGVPGDAFGARHPTMPNRIVRLLPTGIISFQTIYGAKSGGFGAKKEIEQEVQQANRESFLDTFYLDKDGDLWTSSYIFLTDHITGTDILRFLDMEHTSFMMEVATTGLVKHLK
jgi:hypothetical protein